MSEWVLPPTAASAGDVSLALPALGPGAVGSASPPPPPLPPATARHAFHPPPRALAAHGLPFDTEGAVARALALARSVTAAVAEASAATVAGLDAQREAAGWAPPPALPSAASPAALPRARRAAGGAVGDGPAAGAPPRLPWAAAALPPPEPPTRQELLAASPRKPAGAGAAAAPRSPAPRAAALPPPAEQLPLVLGSAAPSRDALVGALSRARGVRRGLARLRGEVGAMLLQTGRAFEALADGVGAAAARGDAVRAAMAEELGGARAEAGAAAAAAADAAADAAQLRRALSEALARQAALERALMASAEAQRSLRDGLAAVTGSVRVVLRLRPLLPGDLARRDALLALVTRWAAEGFLAVAPGGALRGAREAPARGCTLSHFARLLGWASGDGEALCRAARVGAGGGGGGGGGALAGAADVAPALLVVPAAPGGNGAGEGAVKDRVFTLPPLGEAALWGPPPGHAAGAAAPWLLDKFASACAGEGACHSFDRVFGPAATQEAVFAELRPFLDAGLHGRSVTVLAYGATGSGKSHTLLGGGAWPAAPDALLALPGVGARGLPPARPAPADAAAGADNAAPGVLPRALAYLWDALRSEAGGEGDRSLGLSVLEVYNEEVRDLLAGAGASPARRAAAPPQPPPQQQQQQQQQPHAVGPLSPGKTTGSGRPLAAQASSGAADGTGGATVFPCHSLAAALGALGGALARRVQAPTVVNETSSRSHCVVRFLVRGGGGANTSTTISVADLAGVENLRESRAAGASAAEACAVNTSLAAVGDCVAAVARGGAGVQHSFRASRLTRILEPTLRQGARCLVLLTATLMPSQREQLAATLRFAAKLGGGAAAGAQQKPSKAEARAAVEAYLAGRWAEGEEVGRI